MSMTELWFLLLCLAPVFMAIGFFIGGMMVALGMKFQLEEIGMYKEYKKRVERLNILREARKRNRKRV